MQVPGEGAEGQAEVLGGLGVEVTVQPRPAGEAISGKLLRSLFQQARLRADEMAAATEQLLELRGTRTGGSMGIAGSGYLPGSTVTVVVYSTPTVLDSLVTKADGSFDTDVTLPAGLPAGEHTLVATGVDRNGATWTLTQPITARAGDTGETPVVATPADASSSAEGDTTASAAGDPAPSATGGLAYTGADVAVPAIGGLLVLAAGTGLIALSRRRRATGRR
jgi:hypothetical protein